MTACEQVLCPEFASNTLFLGGDVGEDSFHSLHNQPGLKNSMQAGFVLKTLSFSLHSIILPSSDSDATLIVLRMSICAFAHADRPRRVDGRLGSRKGGGRKGEHELQGREVLLPLLWMGSWTARQGVNPCNHTA